MQRLTPRRLTRRSTRGPGVARDGERGATAVLLAFLMVPVLGVAALAVDIGALYAERAKLQVAADAAALAVAADCARGACGDMQATAQELVTANLGTAVAAPPQLSENPTSVTVTGSTPKQHWFAPVIGHDATAVSATATVAWGGPGGGTAALPLIFSWCEFLAQTGGGLPSGTTQRTIRLPKKSDADCPGPKSGNPVPGGFGWLKTDGNTCRATTRIGQEAESEPGNNPSKGCEPEDFEALRNRTVLLPIYDQAGGNGNHAWYRVYAYAAFTITDWDFSGQYKGQACDAGSGTGTSAGTGTGTSAGAGGGKDKGNGKGGDGGTDDGGGAGGSDRCIRGYFTRFVEPTDGFFYDSTAPALGAWILRLIR
ncbi:Tad domain-containing protein [Geodermatophilus sp. YIM 151500]|uniref:Tad domain-containing protein n=1 Tax=Geodermatophilus sp. YIM 151500 TaxID=2984531 RepID=UPI0021E42128|nr:Tad domain-containing protein [Geodermatophilus sp. YIM 151500]MCV2490000.1 Tad domain-containing protein [Geodermatophilus sp. YIM 151500]